VDTCFAEMAMSDDLPDQTPKCQWCGQDTSLFYSFVDPTSGRRVRTYKCKACGKETPVPVIPPE
jgi:hypothetical protein